MSIGYVFDDAFLMHEAPAGVRHPECPERLAAIRDELQRTGLLDRLVRMAAREATRAEVEAAHDKAWIGRLEGALVGSGYLDPDTFFSEGTRRAAWTAAGSAVELVTRIAREQVDAGVALVRPPGHHATRDRAMGFCLLNNVAIAARALRDTGLARRIAILDWDVHHGNGTEDIFWDDPDVLYVSIHQWPAYPGTGPATATGGPNAPGTIVDVPLPAGCGDDDYLAVFDRIIAPSVRWFAPDFMLVSAGYDPWSRDPLGGMQVSRAGFASLAFKAYDLAGRRRFAAILEGGYDCAALGTLVADLVRVLLGDEVELARDGGQASASCTRVMDEVLATHAHRWTAHG